MRRVRAATVTVLRGVLLGVVCGALLAPASAVAVSPSGPAAAYRTAPDAKPVHGAASSAEGPRLRPGTYTDTVSAGERKFYRVVLDDVSNAYVSAVLAPPPGSPVGATDGVRIALESADGEKCSVSNDVTFGSSTARPVADYATRRIGKGRECQAAGDYVYSVEWIGSGAGSGARDWPLELKYMTEPGVGDGAQTPAPSSWATRPADPVTGAAKGVDGGSGFNDAPAVGHGVWKDRLSPGESRFYKVPVEWGQQVFLDAEFAGTATGRAASVPDGLRLTLFNTGRGFVKNEATGYRGGPSEVSLGTAPAAFANRTSPRDDTGAMRFSGWYYVRVSLDQRVDTALSLTLRVGVEGDRVEGPAYTGDAVAAGFGLSDEDRAAAQAGRASSGSGTGNSALYKAVGYTGIGLGTALVLILAVWTLLARRSRGRHVRQPLPWEPRAH
ncbi:hypothetical protein [Streptomyces sp. CA-251247]|uniref:hypothetical protein n=1 Tax=Streptomyces sp. CA-251247 TaxID=3240062 RepID=UPI003D8FAE22